MSSQPQILPLTIPKVGVAQYIMELANLNNITYLENRLDNWADNVSRLAGDEVKPDHIEDMIIALKRAGKISKKDVAELSISYLREKKQSVRSL